jgi:magnesium-protoporphyrin IX monomethyl ester (oxidative) cyclase
LISKYGVKEVTIFDDQFFANKKRVYDFCYYFIKRKGKIYFSYDAGTSPWLVDKPLLEEMKRAGFYAIRFPIETGNLQTLKFIKKPVDLEKAKELIKVANRLGYWTSANFILGFPYETKAEMEETIKYAYESGLDFTSFIAARPHKGAELYDIYEKEGLLKKGIIHTSIFDQSDYDTTQMTAKEITQIISKASKGWYFNKFKFFINPYNFMNYFLPKIKSFDDFLYTCKMFAKLIRIKILPLSKRR